MLGLGLATHTPVAGSPAIEVADVDGVKLAGLVLDAGPVKSPVLLRVGGKDSRENHRDNPIFLHDIFCRVGGPGAGAVDTCVEINSSQIVGDYP